jgi:hypothetical protein
VGLEAERRGTFLPMIDYVFLSTTSVAIILVGVAMLAMLTTLVLGTFGDPERNYTAVQFMSLAAIWATAILVVVLIRLQI